MHTCMYAYTREWQGLQFTHGMRTCLLVCVCMCVLVYSSCYIYKMFLQTETYSLFHSISFKKNNISVINRIIKMSNITTEKKELE